MRHISSIAGTLLLMLLAATATPHAAGHRTMRVGLEEEFCSHDINHSLLHLLEERMVEHSPERHFAQLV